MNKIEYQKLYKDTCDMFFITSSEDKDLVIKEIIELAEMGISISVFKHMYLI